MPLAPHHHPELIHPTAFIAPNAIVVGQVTIGAEVSVWFGVVIRGDSEVVRIGPQSNVQDGCILHADPGAPCIFLHRQKYRPTGVAGAWGHHAEARSEYRG